MKRKINNKGALELSVGTIVVIVIAITMLILGLVLVRTIFRGSTESIDVLNEGVQDEIASLFAGEGLDVVVKLGEGQTVRIKPDDKTFGVGVGARTPDGSAVGGRSRLQYKLSLDSPTGSNCASKLGLAQTERLFVTPLNSFRGFDAFDGANAFSLVEIKVPKGTAVCSQKVFIDVRDTQSASTEAFGGNFFIVEIVKAGLFS